MQRDHINSSRSKMISLQFLILLFSFMGLTSCQEDLPNHSQYKVSRVGELDLHSQTVEEPIALNGLWQFYPSQLIDPKDSFALWQHFDSIMVPKSWIQKTHEGFGYATYRFTILNPPADLALSLAHVRSSYDLYVNGHLLARNGVVSPNAHNGRAQYLPTVVALDGNQKRMELLFHVSNYMHHSGGITKEVWIGSMSSLLKKRSAAIAWDAFIVGALVLFGFYHLALYILHHDRTALYFMGCYFFFALRIISTNSLILMQAFPNLNAEVLLKMEYAGVFGISLFMLANQRMFPKIVLRMPTYLFVGITGLLLVLGTILPPPYFTYAGVAWQVSSAIGMFMFFVFAMRSYLQKRLDHSAIYSVVFVLICISILNEALHSAGIIHTFPTIMGTALLVLLLQSLLLSQTFVKAVANARTISVELEIRAQRERELRRTKLRLQCMLDWMPEIVAAADEDGCLFFGNKAFCKKYGSLDSLSKKRLDEIFPIGVTISKSEIEVEEDVLVLYLEHQKTPSYQNAQELVASLQESRNRLLKLTTMFPHENRLQLHTELEYIQESLIRSSTDLVKRGLLHKRQLAPKLLKEAIDFWQQSTGKSKFDLARESRLWSIDISADGWMRTRTLDKYLSITTMPERPRWEKVVQTVEYVLCEPVSEDTHRNSLIELLEEFKQMDL